MPTAFTFRVGRFFSFGEKGHSGIELDEQIVVFAGSDLEFIFEEIVRLFRAERLKIKLRIRLEYLVDKLFERTPGSARRLQNAHGEVFHFFPRERLFFYGGLLLALLFLGGGLFYRFIDFFLLRTVRFLFGLFFGQKVFEYEKAVAGFHERLGRLSFSRADNENIALSESLGKTGKVAVAGKQTKGVDVAGIGTTGLITYMRTDSLRISEEARAAANEYIRNTYGDKYLPEKPRYFKSRSNAQDGHEAIRPAVPSPWSP